MDSIRAALKKIKSWCHCGSVEGSSQRSHSELPCGSRNSTPNSSGRSNAVGTSDEMSSSSKLLNTYNHDEKANESRISFEKARRASSGCRRLVRAHVRKSISPVEKLVRKSGSLKKCRSDPCYYGSTAISSFSEVSFGCSASLWSSDLDQVYFHEDGLDRSWSMDEFDTFEDLTDVISIEENSNRRQAILNSLVTLSLLKTEESVKISEERRNLLDHSETAVGLNMTNVWFNNLIGLPEELGFHHCFIDYLNFRCCDSAVLENLLQRPVNFALNEKKVFAEILTPDTKIIALVKVGIPAYYSFCLGRAVLQTTFHHCDVCHMCSDVSHVHCTNCNRCCIGLGIGSRCEHCDFRTEGFTETALSVASLSEIIDELDSVTCSDKNKQ